MTARACAPRPWRGRRVVLLAALALAALAPAHAARRTIAVPFYSAEQFAHALHRDFTAPRATAFATAARTLEASTAAWCGNVAPPRATALQETARADWVEAMVAWTRFSAVMVGPLVERKSARVIDFAPVRPALIERAIAAAPQGAGAMEQVGGPAKGFGTLEWLLWTKPAVPGTPACRYAVEVSADIAREAAALSAAFATLAQREWDEVAAVAVLDEAFNQWLGAIDRLRWAQMDKPLRAAGQRTPEYPRMAAGATTAHWRAQWDAIEALGYGNDAAPAVGDGLIPWAAYLRGRGLNPAADALGQATARAAARVNAADPARASSVRAAVESLGTVKRTAESKVAPALKISVGFSDADGD